MTASVSRALGRVGFAVIAASVLAVALTGCISADPVPVAGGAKPVATASDLPLAVVTPTASAAPTVVGVATGLTCNDVLSPDDLYAMKGGANMALDPSAKPGAGTMASRLVALNGIACVYVNASSGEKFTVGVARITPASMSLAKSTIATEQGASYKVAAYSALPSTVGYFRVYSGIGLASVATAQYWFGVSSDTFETATDAKQIVLRIEKSLGK